MGDGSGAGTVQKRQGAGERSWEQSAAQVVDACMRRGGSVGEGMKLIGRAQPIIGRERGVGRLGLSPRREKGGAGVWALRAERKREGGERRVLPFFFANQNFKYIF